MGVGHDGRNSSPAGQANRRGHWAGQMLLIVLAVIAADHSRKRHHGRKPSAMNRSHGMKSVYRKMTSNVMLY